MVGELPGGPDVGAGLKLQVNCRKSRHRPRSNVLKPWNSVEQILFQRHGDQLLDLFGRQAESLGLDLNGGRVELGVDIDCRVVQLKQTHSKDPDGRRHHEPRKPQGCTDNPLDHRAPYGR